MSLPPFDEVVTRHGAAVLRVCRALVGPNDADDAWSETFLSAMRAYPQLPPDSNVRGWLVTIAHHRSIDLLRGRDRTPIPTETIEAAAPAVALSAQGIPGGDGGSLGDDLRHALERLPTKQRHAVVYHHLGGLRYAEVGAVMGTSEAAARRSAADGIAALRRARRARNEEETR